MKEVDSKLDVHGRKKIGSITTNTCDTQFQSASKQLMQKAIPSTHATV